MNCPIRLTVVMTHPVQYYSAWFRYIASKCPEIDLTVLYATEPTAEQQGVGFGHAIKWDVPLMEGHRSRIVRSARKGDSVSSSHFFGLDVPEIDSALRESRPEVVLVPGWHSITLLRTLWTCRRERVPVLYRGDTHLGNAPAGWSRLVWSMRTWALLRCFDGYLSVGRQSDVYLRHFGVRETQIFPAPHCVDNELFARSAARHQTASGRLAARASFGLRADDFVVLFVGKVEPQKRPLDIVRAVARLGSDVSLLVVGTGSLLAMCQEEADKLGVVVRWAGFINQSEIGRAYAVADCLVLGSSSSSRNGETWGLVVNEAMATGLPSVVSDEVGCGDDLVVQDETGGRFQTGDVAALAESLRRVQSLSRAGHDWASHCRKRVEAYSLEHATEGLLRATEAVARRKPRVASSVDRSPSPRILVCCGDMVVVSGLERMTFEVLRVLRERGAVIRCIVNAWENKRIVALAEMIGASWTTGYYWYRFDRHTRNPVKWAQLVWDIVRTSGGLLRDAWRFSPTHIFVPEFSTTLRNAPVLLLLRAAGIPVVLRVGNHPASGSFYRWMWHRVLPPLVTCFVANSEFGADRLVKSGVPLRKIVTIHNTVSRRAVRPAEDAEVVSLVASRRTVLCVGQIAPFKGTHLVIEATKALLDAGEDLQTVIVGRQPQWPQDLKDYSEALERRVLAAGLSERIHFVGERENTLEIMRAGYTLAAPILQEETFGNVALEAKSVGLPVVAFPTGGLRELVEHEVTGYLCSSATLQALIEGLKYFLTDSARREKASLASVAALARAEDKYSRAIFERCWSSLFEDLRR